MLKIAQSIKEFGFLNPVLIDKDYNIIAGHGRVEALKLLAWTKVPALFVEGLTEAQRKAYILADNKLTELGGWNFELVQEELAELGEMDFDISLTGFDNVGADGFGEDFALPNDGRNELCQITFTLHEMQKDLVNSVLDEIDESQETFGNTNSNGNKLYEVFRQWRMQRK